MLVGDKYVPCDNCPPASVTAGKSDTSTKGKQSLTGAGGEEGWGKAWSESALATFKVQL